MLPRDGVRRKSLDTARWAIKLIERFTYRELAELGEDRQVRQIQRLVVGLRRKLEGYDVEAAHKMRAACKAIIAFGLCRARARREAATCVVRRERSPCACAESGACRDWRA